MKFYGDYYLRPVSGKSRTRDPRVFNLNEISILRRVANGENSAAIARAMGSSAASIRQIRKRMRDAFGVDSDRDLLAIPEVQTQIS